MKLATTRVAGAAALAVILGGCATGSAHQPETTTQASSSSTSPVTSPTTSHTASRTASPTTSPARSRTASTPSRSVSPVPAASTRQPSCGNARLGAAIARVEGAAGSRYLTVRLTNIGGHSCRMVGYPGVSILAEDRASQLGAAADRDTSVRPAPVVLAPGASTTFVLRVTQALNYPAATCRPAKGYGYRVYPPDSRTAALLADSDLRGCASSSVHLMTVRPVGASV